MATRVTSLGVGKLTSTDPYVSTFLVEIYSDSLMTIKVGQASAFADFFGGVWLQRDTVFFDGLVFGNTYFLRATTVAPISGTLGTWTNFSIVAGSSTTPAPTYGIVSQTATFSGINYVVSVASVPVDIEHFEWTYTTDGSTPGSTVKPKGTVVQDPTSGNLVLFAGATVGVNVQLYIRAVNTAQLVQAWTAPFLVMQALSSVLDNMADGVTRVAVSPNQRTGAGLAFTNISASDNTYAAIPYHGSAFRRVTPTNEGGGQSANAGINVAFATTGSFILQIPSGFSVYKGLMTITKTGASTNYSMQARLKIGSLFSNVITLTSPSTTINGVVTVTGITGGTQITVEVQSATNNTAGAASVNNSTGFGHNEYTDQDVSNLQ